MEATTPTAMAEASTGSTTIADLLPSAARKHGPKVAIRYKRDGTWKEVSYAQLGEVVADLAVGLIALGLQPGERICILANTRPEWSYADFAISSAGGVVVPIYPTNSPAECEWVAGNSQARMIVCEDAGQAEKIAQVRGQLPALQTVIVMEGPAPEGALTLDEVRERGRGAARDELDRRTQGVAPEDPFTIIYTSGTTGPPKGCVLTHANYRAIVDMCEQAGTVDPDDVTYLFLPLAHSFALLMQLLTFDVGATLAYFGGDTKQIVPELGEVHPTFLPSVPRIFEKIYTLVTSHGDPATIAKGTEVGLKVRELQGRGEELPAELQAAFDQFEEKLYKNVRAVFGGQVKQCLTGAAPIAPEILRFFYACGVPVLEGYGMTETSTGATFSTVESFKIGTVGRPLPGVEIRIAPDGEVLLRGANMFKEYYRNPQATQDTYDAEGWLHTGDVGSVDEEGFLSITGRKKDIIITAGGKNLTPANIENDLKQSRYISQAVMHGDRRPFPVALITLDPEEILPWAQTQGKPADLAALAEDADVQAMVQAELDRANANYAQVEQVKKFVILDHDLSQETGELTPTLKVKRNVINEKYADLFEALYG